MSAYPTWTIALDSESFPSINADVVDFNCSWGISGNKYFDRIASTGVMQFTLKNQDDLYIPGHPSALAGWGRGVPVELQAVYDGETYVKFRGIIDGFEVYPGDPISMVKVTVVDWLDYLARQPLVLPTVKTQWRADQVINALMELVPTPPQAQEIDTGTKTFKAVFDSTTSKTKVYTELVKAVNSEFGHLYLRKNKDNGEKLVFENYARRNGLSALAVVPKPAAELGFMLLETGDKVLLETGNKVILNETEAAVVIDADISGMEVSYGDNMLNYVKITAHPKTLGSSIVLFSIGSPLSLASGESKTIVGNYRDPVGGAAVNGYDMVTPVVTTDYLMNTAADGSGTNISAYLTVTATYGASSVSYALKNASEYAGYVTLLQARGKAIYNVDKIEYIAESTASEADYGTASQTLDQAYQQDLALGSKVADLGLLQEKNPRTVVNSVSFYANRNADIMTAFLNLDVGDMVNIKSTQMGVDAYYYIQGVEFSVDVDQTAIVTWKVKQAFTVDNGLTGIDMEFSHSTPGSASVDAMMFPALPQINSLANLTVCAWIYPHVPGGYTYQYVIGGNYNGEMGWWIGMDQDDLYLVFGQQGTRAATRGEWKTANGTLTANAWNHVAITRDTTTAANAPVMYIDGVSKSVTQVTAQSGATGDDTGMPFTIGNVKQIYPNEFVCPYDGKIEDFRIYNRILTGTEIAAIDAGDDPVISTGLKFWSNFVYTKDSADYIDETLTSETTIIDAISGEVGKPNGAVIAGASEAE